MFPTCATQLRTGAGPDLWVAMLHIHCGSRQRGDLPVNMALSAFGAAPACRFHRTRLGIGESASAARLPAQAALVIGVVTVLATVLASRWFDTVAVNGAAGTERAGGVAGLFSYTLGPGAVASGKAEAGAGVACSHPPHFLFNSINGVLGVLRREPPRESALMDMADLFRVLMRENRDLQPLADEITLTRQVSISKLRLGDRLHVVWKLDKMPADAMVPPLVLQPIAENAVTTVSNLRRLLVRSRLKWPACALSFSSR